MPVLSGLFVAAFVKFAGYVLAGWALKRLEPKIEAPAVLVPASETPVVLEPPVLDEDRGSLTN